MLQFSTRPLAHTEDLDSGLDLSLRVDTRIVPQGGGRGTRHDAPREEQPVFLSADQMSGSDGVASVAEGSVELRKADTVMTADRMTYRPIEDEVEAEGNVLMERAGDLVTGPRARLRLSDHVGYFDQPEYRLRHEQVRRYQSERIEAAGNLSLLDGRPESTVTEGYGHAERIDFKGENLTSILNGTFTTCKADDPDWYVKAKQIDLDYDQEVGEVENGNIYFKDIPFLYLPTFSFPLDNRRKSGLLAPTFASSTRNGFDFTQPIYWNVAPNYDVTFSPREISKRGAQLGTSVRYLSNNYSGTSNFEYLPGDQLADRDRYAYSIVHQQDFGQSVKASIDWSGVSDDYYFQDLTSSLVDTSRVNLKREVSLSYQPDAWWSATAKVLKYQTLQTDESNLVDIPYAMEPRLELNGRIPDTHGLDLALATQYTDFRNTDSSKVEGKRYVFYPQVTLPIETSSFFLRPKLAIHATQYELNGQGGYAAGTYTRTLPIASLDTGLVFERDTEFGGDAYVQTLEPRLYYVNIPYKDQSNLPVFDTAASDFSYAQMFTENRYSGYDRINDANQLTAAMTTRLIDPETGAERVKAMLGQRYYFNPQRVVLPGETARTDRFSTVLAAVSASLGRSINLDSAWEYDYEQQRNERFSVGARYQPAPGKVLSSSYRYTRDSVDQIDLAAQWPLNGRWFAVSRYNYSFLGNRPIEVIGGLEYNAGCWVGRFVAQRKNLSGSLPNTTYYFQIEFNDFAQIGSNPLQLLRRSVPGYDKVNDVSGGASSDGSIISE